ncbi:Glutathione S-transferase/chloride channel [Ophiocordyceps camponoti-floridani]|uniref:Glutathione S-transferase/chloride channel n=1 Tax=Ophiocordyceps camponoti-floridani TaxID=2030778 RepID=A0A8H4QB48_9HYPO|nr:Glutathione S-transferase/chloride channel [Ophiocordyceps camponoti-floridani]
MADMQPLVLWVPANGPPPYKVLLVLEELGLPFEKIPVNDPMDPSYLAINAHGRLPTLRDPNSDDLALYDENCILEYLVDTYDNDGILSLKSDHEKYRREKWKLKQFLHFHSHPPNDTVNQQQDLDLAQTVQDFEILNGILEDKAYLTGDDFTYADLCWVPWDVYVTQTVPSVWEANDVLAKYPNYVAWHERLMQRPAVRKVYGLE